MVIHSIKNSMENFWVIHANHEQGVGKVHMENLLRLPKIPSITKNPKFKGY
jgi:hypothetical protein